MTNKIDQTAYDAAVQASQTVVDALAALQAELDETRKTGTAEQQTELQNRITTMGYDLEVKRDAVIRLTPPDTRARMAEVLAAQAGKK